METSIALHSVAHRVSHQIPAESEMSRQNRATPPQIKVSHLSPDPLSHFPLIRSRQGARGGGGVASGLVEGIAALLGSENGSRYRGCRSYSHTSRATLSTKPPRTLSKPLTKDFRLQPGLERKFFLRRTWSGQKLLPLQFPALSPLSKKNQVSLVRTVLSHSGSESQISRLGTPVGTCTPLRKLPRVKTQGSCDNMLLRIGDEN